MSKPINPGWYKYKLMDLAPEVPEGHEFMSQVKDLDTKPDLWDDECPYALNDNCSVVKEEKQGILHEVTLRIKKATVVVTHGTDQVCFDVDLPTAFPEMRYATTMVVHARHNYGKEWCETVLGITPEVVGCGASTR